MIKNRVCRWMVRMVAAGALAATVLTNGSGPAVADPATDGAVIRAWNQLAFAAVREAVAGDAAAARAYAMVNVAMYDAVNGLAAHPHPSALVAPSEAKAGDPVVAASRAAHDVLSAVFPRLRSSYDDQLDADRASSHAPGQAKLGDAWGAQVAAAVVADRANDGTQTPYTHPALAGPGLYGPAWGNAQYRDMRPFAIANSSTYVGGPPPALTSVEYANAFNDVKARGDASVDDPLALKTFKFWSLGNTTNQPPGGWLQITGTVSQDRGLSLDDTAWLHALESMALADTVAPTFTTKDLYYRWRPTLAINSADTDGNDATEKPTQPWAARGGNSASPEYWSGHSSFSAAGARVLAGFFCDDAVSFTFTSDSGNGATRSFTSFSDAAAQAGESRVLGGLHFDYSNQAGLAAGRAVADEVLQRGPTC